MNIRYNYVYKGLNGHSTAGAVTSGASLDQTMERLLRAGIDMDSVQIECYYVELEPQQVVVPGKKW
jgi:hypothetical protein